jgi:hypothetical protein
MERRFCLEAMIHIIDDVLRGENHIDANVTKRQMQDGGRLREQFFVRQIRIQSSRRKKYERRVRGRVL